MSKTTSASETSAVGETGDAEENTPALLAAIIASSEDAIVSKTLDSIVTSWNGAAERIFGFTAQEMIGQSILRIIPPRLHYEENEILAKLRQGERIERYETIRMRKDGTELAISLTIAPVRDSRGKIVGAAKVAHDITSRRQDEIKLKELAAEKEQLLEAERTARSHAENLSRMKDEFLATLSHELRTPLQAIQGWVTVLRAQHPTSEDYKKGLEIIDRNVRAQTQIVNDLLDMSRIISGKVHLEVQSISLNDIVNNAIDSVRQTAAAKEIRILPVLDSKIGTIRGDPHRLQQVIWNLLTNAVKFTPKGGRVQIALERVNSHAEICVEDNGIGIEPDFLPHVFDRFRQADSSTTRRYGGLGLGLSVVKTLVELHGGSVRVKSRGENQGSTFIVGLPIAHAREEKGAIAGTSFEQPLEIPPLTDVNVLIVDDDTDGCSVIKRILEGFGATATCTSNAKEALEILRQKQFSILLSDIGMPDMDGFQLIRKIRSLSQDAGARIPAIAITAYARPEERQRCLLAGFNMHLPKPVEGGELVASIAALLYLGR